MYFDGVPVPPTCKSGRQPLETGLPRPRTRDVFSTPRFNEVREQVWSLLMREAEQAERELQEVR